MCGRFTNRMTWTEMAGLYQLTDWPQVEIPPRYNIAPTQQVPVVFGEPRVGAMMGFGIQSPKRLLLNARAETVHRLPSFRELFNTRRCLVPADGFYEWKKLGKERQPYLFSMASREPFALAAIYDRDQFSLITTTANDLVAEAHDRMPVILSREGYGDWLRTETSADVLKAMLRPFPASEMQAWPVSRRVNKAADDDAGLIRQVEEERGFFSWSSSVPLKIGRGAAGGEERQQIGSLTMQTFAGYHLRTAVSAFQ